MGCRLPDEWRGLAGTLLDGFLHNAPDLLFRHCGLPLPKERNADTESDHCWRYQQGNWQRNARFPCQCDHGRDDPPDEDEAAPETEEDPRSDGDGEAPREVRFATLIDEPTSEDRGEIIVYPGSMVSQPHFVLTDPTDNAAAEKRCEYGSMRPLPQAFGHLGRPSVQFEPDWADRE